MAEKNTVPNLEAKASDGNQYLFPGRDNGWRDSGNSLNGNTKSTSHL